LSATTKNITAEQTGSYPIVKVMDSSLKKSLDNSFYNIKKKRTLGTAGFQGFSIIPVRDKLSL